MWKSEFRAPSRKGYLGEAPKAAPKEASKPPASAKGGGGSFLLKAPKFRNHVWHSIVE